MVVVYKAYDTRLEREVALKLIRTSEIPHSQLNRSGWQVINLFEL
jgi:hypothetical protein